MHTALQRLDANRVRVLAANGVDITLFANEQVFLDPASVDEIRSFATLGSTLNALNTLGFFGDAPARIERLVLTPDFHRGAGIPVGTVIDARNFVLPQAVGTDIGCGMRLIATDITENELARLGDAFDRSLRYIFFEGGRNIPMSAAQRTAMLRDGLRGLLQCPHSGEGVWRLWDAGAQELDILRTHRLGALTTEGIFELDGFITGSGQAFSRDGQIGSIGGGNHFVELQRVEEIFDGATARSWGLKRGAITIMVHSGSLGIGHLAGSHFADEAKSMFPRGAKRPEHGVYPLPPDAPAGRRYLSAMGNAANFAFANRLFLGLMMVRALSETLSREVGASLIYDAPHNLIWDENGGRMIHRKGACPADGPSADTEFPAGHPVIIPGSMGSSSYVLRGHGATESLCSACHGAGRRAPRQQARRGFAAELEPLRIVTKVDQRRLRRDVRANWERSLLEEAPSCYKDVTPVIETVTGAGIASQVARLWPLLTVKGI